MRTYQITDGSPIGEPYPSLEAALPHSNGLSSMIAIGDTGLIFDNYTLHTIDTSTADQTCVVCGKMPSAPDECRPEGLEGDDKCITVIPDPNRLTPEDATTIYTHIGKKLGATVTRLMGDDHPSFVQDDLQAFLKITWEPAA